MYISIDGQVIEFSTTTTLSSSSSAIAIVTTTSRLDETDKQKHYPPSRLIMADHSLPVLRPVLLYTPTQCFSTTIGYPASSLVDLVYRRHRGHSAGPYPLFNKRRGINREKAKREIKMIIYIYNRKQTKLRKENERKKMLYKQNKKKNKVTKIKK